MTTVTTRKATRAKANLYINPKAPPWLKTMLRDVFSDANELNAEDMTAKLTRAMNKRRPGRKPIGARAMTGSERVRRYREKRQRNAKRT
jgi:hypothetical protein